MSLISSPAVQTGLRDHHRKLTRPRQAILTILTEADRHLTPAEIYARARAAHVQIGLTTVYRTLDLLADLGYVQRVHGAEGCHSYAPATQGHGHLLICSQCGRAESFSDCDLGALMTSLERRTGFQIDVHVLELRGHCPDCRMAARSKRRSKGGNQKTTQ